MEDERDSMRRSESQVGFGLKSCGSLGPAQQGVDPVLYAESKEVIAQAAVQVEAALPQIDALLQITRRVGDMCVGPGRHTHGIALDPGIEPDIDLVVVEIAAGDKKGPVSKKVEGMKQLGIGALLQARVVLLNPITTGLISQKESKIGIQIEERASQKAVNFQGVTVFPRLIVIS